MHLRVLSRISILVPRQLGQIPVPRQGRQFLIPGDASRLTVGITGSNMTASIRTMYCNIPRLLQALSLGDGGVVLPVVFRSTQESIISQVPEVLGGQEQAVIQRRGLFGFPGASIMTLRKAHHVLAGVPIAERRNRLMTAFVTREIGFDAHPPALL
jgi:hypothetical protein